MIEDKITNAHVISRQLFAFNGEFDHNKFSADPIVINNISGISIKPAYDHDRLSQHDVYPLWTSSLDGGDYISPSWIEWCDAECFGSHDNAAIITVASSAKILHILDRWDADSIPDGYLIDRSGSYLEKYLQLDFEKLKAEGYDGVHVDPYFSRRYAPSRYSGFSSWDCESTVWLRHGCLSIEAVISMEEFKSGSKRI